MPFRVVLVVVLILSSPARAEGAIERAQAGLKAAQGEAAMHVGAAEALSQVVGVQVSPLVVLAVAGGYRLWVLREADDAARPFHSRAWFVTVVWIVLVALFLARRLPAPLDKVAQAVKLFENKVSAIAAFLVTAPALVAALTAPLQDSAEMAWNLVAVPALAEPPSSMPEGLWITGRVLAWIVVVVIAGAVWSLSQAIHVLVLLSPFSLVDKLLVSMRIVVLVALFGAAAVHPVAGLVVCLPLVGAALVLVGWSWRWTVFGAVFSADLLLARSDRPGPAVPAFAARVPETPARTFGRIATQDGRLFFQSRRWFGIGPWKRVPLTNEPMAIERGVLSSTLFAVVDGRTLCRFPPRLRGHEDTIASILGGLPVETHPLKQGLDAAWAWVRTQLTTPVFENPT